MNPELLMVETDHDLRNSGRLPGRSTGSPRAIFHIPGIGRVQTITRPLGTPIEHTLDPVP